MLKIKIQKEILIIQKINFRLFGSRKIKTVVLLLTILLIQIFISDNMLIITSLYLY
jgi:hypothetical protein